MNDFQFELPEVCESAVDLGKFGHLWSSVNRPYFGDFYIFYTKIIPKFTEFGSISENFYPQIHFSVSMRVEKE